LYFIVIYRNPLYGDSKFIILRRHKGSYFCI